MLLDLQNPARFCRCSLFHQHCRLSCWCTHFTWSWNYQNDQHKLRMKTCAVILSPINCHPMNKQWTAPQNLMKNVDTDPESWGISKSFQYLQQNVPYHSMKYTKPVALYQLPGKDILSLSIQVIILSKTVLKSSQFEILSQVPPFSGVHAVLHLPPINAA